ncbi:hypothetical protein Landi51_11360 [Colletotrichum acutatum]
MSNTTSSSQTQQNTPLIPSSSTAPRPPAERGLGYQLYINPHRCLRLSSPDVPHFKDSLFTPVPAPQSPSTESGYYSSPHLHSDTSFSNTPRIAISLTETQPRSPPPSHSPCSLFPVKIINLNAY